jgi:hypothetical protein
MVLLGFWFFFLDNVACHIAFSWGGRGNISASVEIELYIKKKYASRSLGYLVRPSENASTTIPLVVTE